MRASFDEKMRLIDAIVLAVESGPDGTRVTVANVAWLREALYRLTLDELRAIGLPSTLADAAKRIGATEDRVARIGSTSNELVYYPITPCRYIDTRIVGGPLVAGPRTFDLTLTGGAYGGSVACDPRQIVGGDKEKIGALAVNVTAIGTLSPIGYIGVRPAGDTANTSFVNWYAQGPGVQAANAGIVAINQSATPAADIEFFGSPTDFIVDVFGVFAAPSATALDCVAGGIQSATLDTTTRNYAITAPACGAGYKPMSVKCDATGDSASGRMRKAEGGLNNPGPAGTCSGYYSGASTATATAQNLCCRIPGR